MKISKWIKSYDFGDSVGLYQPLTIKKSFVSPDTFERMRNGDLENEGLRRSGMLVKDDEEDEKLRDRVFEEVREQQSSPQIQTAYFIITERCNLDCDYCFIPEKSTKMDQDTALENAERLTELADENENTEVIFYGGEPLLGEEIVRNVVEYLEEQPQNFNFSMNTNGTLLNSNFVNFMDEHRIKTALSIDGRKAEHETYRDDFEKVIEGYEMLRNADVQTTISCTIGEHNLEELPEIMEYFGSDLNADSVGFNIPMCNAEGEFPGISVDIDDVSDQIIEAFKVARKHNVYEDRIMRPVKAFANEDFRIRDCAGYGGQVVFSPDGKIGPCHGFLHNRKYFSEDFDSETFEKWNERIPVNMDDCKDCEGIALCGGGCGYYSESMEGSLFNSDSRYCNFINKVLDFLMEDLYKGIKEND